jgi:hypothetical protein
LLEKTGVFLHLTARDGIMGVEGKQISVLVALGKEARK